MKILLLSILFTTTCFGNDVEELMKRYDYKNDQNISEEDKKQLDDFMKMAKDHQGDVQELMKKMQSGEGMGIDPKMIGGLKEQLFKLKGSDVSPAVQQQMNKAEKEKIVKDIECQISPEDC